MRGKGRKANRKQRRRKETVRSRGVARTVKCGGQFNGEKRLVENEIVQYISSDTGSGTWTHAEITYAQKKCIQKEDGRNPLKEHVTMKCTIRKGQETQREVTDKRAKRPG